MRDYVFRFLHLSDLHQRGPEEIGSWRRSKVLGSAWQKNIESLCEIGPIDFICFSGDVAYSGVRKEYEQAANFLLSLRERLGLGPDRLFVVPGNHDVNRGISQSEWRRVREAVLSSSRLEITRWLDGHKPPRGLKSSDLQRILERQRDYHVWVSDTLSSIELNEKESHFTLGFRKNIRLTGCPFDIYIIGLNSAWLCGDDDDQGKLLLTDSQVARLTTSSSGEALPGFRLAMVHHPLSHLLDASKIQRMLADSVDLLLRGHLHREEIDSWADPEHRLRQLAAGCLYETHEADQYPNSCHLVEVVSDENGRPSRYNVWFRTWSEAGFWFSDNSLYKESKDGRLTWLLMSRPAQAALHPRVARFFVGRKDIIKAMGSVLLHEGGEEYAPLVCVLQGMPGVGKSYTADRFFFMYRDHFPGGYLRLALDPFRHETNEVLLQRVADGLEISARQIDLAQVIRERLRRPRTYLHIENVDSRVAADSAVRLVNNFGGCAIVISGRFRGLGESAGWQVLEVAPFGSADALLQLNSELGDRWRQGETAAYKALVEKLGCLPLAIHLASGHLRQGRAVSSFMARLHDSALSMTLVDPADPLLDTEKRGIISTTFSLSLELLAETLGPSAERMTSGLRAMGHAPPSGFGRSLGAAIADLDLNEFDELVVLAGSLSLIQVVPENERNDPAWKIHPLIAEYLRRSSDLPGVSDRVTRFFLERLPELPHGQEEDQGIRWKEVQAEREAMSWWLEGVPRDRWREVERSGSVYAIQCGPFSAWSLFCQRLADEATDTLMRSDALWTMANTALQAGNIELAENAAKLKAEIDSKERPWEWASALGTLADILMQKGELDEALRIRTEEQLPIYEEYGDLRSRAITLGKIADVLILRGELDEALRIRREEELPVYEALKDLRLQAVTHGKIGDILFQRGSLDEVLDIRYEKEMPVYKRLGDLRSQAITLGEIADVLYSQGKLVEALRIRENHQIPIYDLLGDRRSRAITRGKIADILVEWGELDKALMIRITDELPVYEELSAPRTRAITVGQLAAIYLLKDEIERSIDIREREELPVYERLGNIRELAIGRANLAECLIIRGRLEDRARARALLERALVDAERLGIPESGRIRAYMLKLIG